MKQNLMFDGFFNGLEKTAQTTLSYYLKKDLILQDIAKSKEIQKMKEEIINEVLNRISISVDNKVRQTLDELFKEFNI